MARINVPPLTRGLLVFVLGLFLVYQAVWHASHTHTIPWIVISPVNSVTYPWVYVSATLTEENPITLLIAAATFFYGGRYLERAWSARDLAIFLLIVSLIPNVLTSLVLLVSASTRTSWSETTVQGCVAVQAGFLVAFKQLVPEHTVTILRGVVKVRVKHFPAVFLAANTLSGLILGTRSATLLAWFGFLAAWTYLRFYKHQPDLAAATTGDGAGATLRGDASETFAFAYFWPDAVHAPIAAVSDAIFNVLVTLRLCTPFSDAEVESGNRQASVRGDELPSLMSPSGGRRGGGSGKREEAERRRALALRALDQRLQQANANRQAQTMPELAPAPAQEDAKEEAQAPRMEGGPAY